MRRLFKRGAGGVQVVGKHTRLSPLFNAPKAFPALWRVFVFPSRWILPMPEAFLLVSFYAAMFCGGALYIKGQFKPPTRPA